MPGLFRDNWDNVDDENTSSDSESGSLEDNILDHHNLPPSPPAIQVYPDRDVDHRDILIRGPRSIHRDSNVSMEILNGFLRVMVPERITGLVIKRNELFYLVLWQNYGNTAYCIQARFMNAYVPTLVIEFYQELIIDLIRNRNV